MSRIIDKNNMKNVIIIGGGPAGMMAGIISAKKGNKVTLIEKNEKLGKKIYITGKGRCNLSNYCDCNEFLNYLVRNSKFMYGALNVFSPKDAYEFFESNGLKLKIERGNRVFPLSDKASDVTKVLEKLLISHGVEIRLNENVKEILTENNCVVGVKTELGDYYCESVIVCTGGVSYPLTGSTGDGFVFAKKLGHEITPLVPSLVGLCLKGGDFSELQGLSLKNVSLKFVHNDKKIYDDFGELLFTHFGISGPIVLSCSAIVNRIKFDNCVVSIDLKPALSVEQLDARLVREFSFANGKQIASIMHKLVPKSMIKLVLSRAKIRFDMKCSEITKQQRADIVSVLKSLTFEVKGLRPIEEAIVTSGGIDVKQISPKSMESKRINGLFFAGEIVDVDAYTGGFNIQTALSMGYLAGLNA